MNNKPIDQARDEDARNALAALQARRIAAQTRTALVVKDGKLVREMVDWDFEESTHR